MRRVWDSRRVAIALLVLYGAATLLVTLHHEPWRDEAETWLVARDLPLTDSLNWTRPAGTPFLWPALVVPFARLGAPYVAQSLLNWAIALAAMAVFLLRAPFPIATKALFAFSFYPAYQYAAIARTYALGILLLFCVAALYEQRHARPLTYALIVALLANANAHSGAPAFAAASFFLFELIPSRSRDARQWLGAILMIAGLALGALQLKTAGHFIPPNVVSAPYPGAFLEATAGAFSPGFEWMIPSMLLLALIVWNLRTHRFALWLALASFAGLAFIFTFLWIGGYRHYGLVLMTCIAALWLAAPSSRALTIALNLSLALSLVMSVRSGYADLTRPYSGSREMGDYIEQHHRGQEIAAHPPAHCEAVLPYLSQRTFNYVALGETGSYLKWDRALRLAQARSSASIAPKARHGLFLSAQPLDAPESYGFKLLYATKEEPLVSDERYWLYAATRP